MSTGPATTTGSDKASRRRPALDRPVAMRLAATEYERWADALDRIGPDQWQVPTDCPEWDVHALAGHVVGMAKMASSMPETMRQNRTAAKMAKRNGTVFVDELTALQVSEHAELTSDQLRHRMREIGPKAARGRRRTPAFVRNRTLPEAQDLPGSAQPEWWAIGYLLDTILTRDPWMHRVDLARATGMPMTLTAEHDGVLVADVVEEWASRHGQPYRLRLSGPAGGSWSAGSDGPEIELDALEFCRAISGRGPADGLLATYVPF